MRLEVLSCKIFEYFALQVDPVIEIIQPRSTPYKDSAILAPKLAFLKEKQLHPL